MFRNEESLEIVFSNLSRFSDSADALLLTLKISIDINKINIILRDIVLKYVPQSRADRRLAKRVLIFRSRSGKLNTYYLCEM